MKSGMKPNKVSHLDYDYHANREKLFGATAIPQFPTFYNADRINWRPNQDIAETTPITHTAQPTGCTNFSTAYCANNLDGDLKLSPDDLEVITHANAQGGADVRSQLNTARKIKWFPAYYNIQPVSMDMFDSISLALVEGALEHRVVSVGTPWYAEFEAVDASGILSMPNLTNISSWHNHVFLGRITINGVPYLMCESHQGANYGDKGLIYWSRELVNAVFSIRGSVAYIPAHAVEDPAKITLDWWNKVLSMIRQFGKSWLPYSYGGVMLWDTPQHCRRNVRVIADEMGLTFSQKNTLCATIKVESNYNPKAQFINRRRDGSIASIDNGICQWNSYYHGNEITPDEATNNPEKAVRLMCTYWKEGLMKQWVAYSSGAYKKWLPTESLPSIAY